MDFYKRFFLNKGNREVCKNTPTSGFNSEADTYYHVRIGCSSLQECEWYMWMLYRCYAAGLYLFKLKYIWFKDDENPKLRVSNNWNIFKKRLISWTRGVKHHVAMKRFLSLFQQGPADTPHHKDGPPKVREDRSQRAAPSHTHRRLSKYRESLFRQRCMTNLQPGEGYRWGMGSGQSHLTPLTWSP